MKIERIQYSLEAATKEITRYAATRRITAVADLLKDEKGYRQHKQERDEDEDEDLEDSPTSSVVAIQASRLLDITA
jgi:hypothetical protein